jgi:hypothetical protein
MVNNYEKLVMDETLEVVLGKYRGIKEHKKLVIPYLIDYYLKHEEYEKLQRLKDYTDKMEKSNENKSKKVKV